jgi:predicted TIM-barrel fold metal-dependent hydrolase
MDKMRIVDADSHIEEVAEIWDLLDPAFQSRRPFPVTLEKNIGHTNLNAFWYIDGAAVPKLEGPGTMLIATPLTSTYARSKPFSVGSQGLTDVKARLQDLDDYGLDVQVIYPTLFIATITDDLAFEAALMRAYNSYLAQACAQAADRLKWAGVIPLRSPAQAVSELRRCKELGAVAITVLGTAGEMLLHDRSLWPIYAEMERLDLPLSVHVGWSHPGLNKGCDNIYLSRISFTLPILAAFWAIIGGGVLDAFPRLRVAFLEAGSEWLPYWIGRMEHYYNADVGNARGGYMPKKRPADYLKEGRVFFTCEADENSLPQVLELLGEDQMMAAADIPHGEAREHSMDIVRKRSDLSERARQKILGDNAARFYQI